MCNERCGLTWCPWFITHYSSPIADIMRTHYCGLVSAAQLDETVTLCGWVNTRRDHGGVIFIDLRDREGIVQIVCNPTRPEVFAVAEKIRNEFVIRVTGKVIRREPALVNPKLKSGEIEVMCREE